MKRLLIFLVAFMAISLLSTPMHGRSALSPRHSGTEPPDSPRGHALPGMMGHMDAYGNTLSDRMPEEKKPRHRLRQGAYGAPAKPGAALPEAPLEQKPVWKFQ